MQETEIDNVRFTIPHSHDGDAEWLVSMLYSKKTRRHEPGPNITEVQRWAMMREYEDIFQEIMAEDGTHKAAGYARRAANIKLRLRVDCCEIMRSGKTYPPELAQ